MMISNRALAAPAPTYAQTMQARDAAKAAKAEEKRVVAQNVAEGLNSARMDAPERAKRDAKAKLIEIAKRVQLLKKLFAGNPKEMARALTQVFKELRAAVKAYKDAGGQELGFAGEAAKGAVANDAAAKTDETSPEAERDEAPVEAEATPAESEEKAPEPEQPAAAVSAVYDAVVGKIRKSIGEDGLDFVKMVRQLVNGANGLRDILEAARAQAKGKKPDKDTDEAFEDADEQIKALAEDLDRMERDIRNAVPEAGMKLSMDA
jgi:hypothetical protein